MSGAPGQVGRWLAHLLPRRGGLLHHLLQLAEALLIVVAVAGGVLAWRLGQAPLDVDWLARRLEAAANAPGAPRLVIGHAALAWEGFAGGVDRPLDIRLSGAALLDAAGTPIAEVPQAELSLSLGGLLLGRIVPRALELDGVRLRAERTADGRLSLELGRLAEETAPPIPFPASGHGGLADLLAGLARPAGHDGGGRNSPWDQLVRVRIRDAGLTVNDRQLGAVWRAGPVTLDVVRRPRGGADATAELTLALADQRVVASARAALPPGGANTTAELHLTPLVPARLAALAPVLAPLKAVDAPVALTATAAFGSGLLPETVTLQARVGGGRLYIGDGSMPLVGAQLGLHASLAGLTLDVQRLETEPRPGGPRTVLRGNLQATRSDAGVAGTITGQFDQVAFADLAELWPEGVGGPGTRPWITENITSGLARNAHFQLRLTAKEDLSEATVTALSGGLDGQDLTVHWLRPVPPLEHGNAHLSFDSPDQLTIAVSGAAQSGGPQGALVAQSGKVVIVGLSGGDQFMTIDADLAGPVADLVGLLSHPRLHLLERSPVELNDPAGTVGGHLTVTRLPLVNSLAIDDVHIHAAGRLGGLHLARIAAGRDLDGGNFDFDVGNDGLNATGTAALAGIPAQLKVALDFRAGGPAQLTERISATATATAAQLAAAGLDTGDLVKGPVKLLASLTTRRDGHREIGVQADLGRAVLAVPRLGFRKPADAPASGELHMTLAHDRITAIDRLQHRRRRHRGGGARRLRRRPPREHPFRASAAGHQHRRCRRRAFPGRAGGAVGGQPERPQHRRLGRVRPRRQGQAGPRRQ